MRQSDWVEAGAPPQLCQLSHRLPLVGIPSVSGERPDLTPHVPRPWAVGVPRGVKQPWDAYIGRATGLQRAPYTGPGWATTYTWLGWSTRPR